ncbi:MAG: hypothetical protein IKX00_04555 [Bacilli bacterium]|nr:hypothetical protein [Bacilli bacterium]
MQTRMEKYTDVHEEVGQRFKKNEDLYKKISDQELDKYTVKTNATVLDDNGTNIDVEHIKRILETRYNNAPKRKSIVIPEDKTEEIPSVVETKEYDINLILEKAKENESNDYDKNRFKKLRDTQYDILKDLNLNPDEISTKEVEQDKDELMKLINTITQKELENRKKEDDPLDLFPDLKGDENTVVLDGMKDEIEKTLESDEVIENEEVKEKELENSFYTTSTVFTQSDFDDFDDLKKEVKSHKILLTIVTIIIVLAILFCIYLLLDHFLSLNLFKG